VSETIESLRAERDAAITRESVLRDALAKASGVLDVITHAEGCDVDDDDENGTALECSCGLNDILASVNAALAHSGSKADTSILICLTVLSLDQQPTSALNVARRSYCRHRAASLRPLALVSSAQRAALPICLTTSAP
jgi:hypothetical protein